MAANRALQLRLLRLHHGATQLFIIQLQPNSACDYRDDHQQDKSEQYSLPAARRRRFLDFGFWLNDLLLG